MTARWPDTLPQRFDRPNFRAGAPDGRLRSKTSTGPGKTRRRTRAAPAPIAGTMTMTGAQLLAFRRFVRDTIDGGVDPFIFPDPHGGLPILAQIGEQMPDWGNMAGDRWIVSLSLERLYTGSFEPGLPALTGGKKYLVHNGAYVLIDLVPIVVTP